MQKLKPRPLKFHPKHQCTMMVRPLLTKARKSEHEKNTYLKKFGFTHCIVEKKYLGVGGFSKILRNFQSGSWQMLTSDYKVGGWGEKRPKTCLRNI